MSEAGRWAAGGAADCRGGVHGWVSNRIRPRAHLARDPL